MICMYTQWRLPPSDSAGSYPDLSPPSPQQISKYIIYFQLIPREAAKPQCELHASVWTIPLFHAIQMLLLNSFTQRSLRSRHTRLFIFFPARKHPTPLFDFNVSGVIRLVPTKGLWWLFQGRKQQSPVNRQARASTEQTCMVSLSPRFLKGILRGLLHDKLRDYWSNYKVLRNQRQRNAAF